MTHRPTPGYSSFRGGHTGRAYNERAFRHFLEVDWQRTRRSANSLLLILTRLRTHAGVNRALSNAQGRAMFEGLAGAIRETDFVGWFSEGRVAAAVLILRAADPMDTRDVVKARVHRSVAHRLPSALEPSLQVRVITLGGRTRREPVATSMGEAPESRARLDPRVRRGWRLTGPLSQPLFRGAFRRERRRAERFAEAVAIARLTPVTVTTAFDSGYEEIADVVGWVQPPAALVFLKPLEPATLENDALALAAAVEEVVRRESRVKAPDAMTVQLEVYEPGVGHADHGLELDTAQRLARAADAGLKRLIDLAGSAACLVLFSPLMLGLALVVKLTSDGPVFFRQQRVGQGGRLFTMLKFRTMRENVGHDIHERFVETFIEANDSSARSGPGAFKMTHDPRVTPIGRLLRRSSLDELPQLWNVLTGHMSLVGPRPAVPYEVARYKRWHQRRVNEVKPGMTGLWQVTGRSATTFNDMVRLDIQYVRNHSVWYDLKILLATPRAVLSGTGAH